MNLAPGTFADTGTLFRDICLPIFLLILAGWIADRKFDLNLDTLVKINLYLFVPAFIFVRVSESELSGALAGRVMLFTFSVIACMFAAATIAARLLSLDRRSGKALQLSTMFYNCGNYGIPLTTLAFPGLGPAVQVFALVTMNISTFSIGILLASTQNHDEPGDPTRTGAWRHFLPVLRQPSIYAIAAAFLLPLAGVQVEEAAFVWSPLQYLASALVSFALVTLGVQLSKTKPPRIAGHLASALVIRLLGGPLVAIPLTLLFQFDSETTRILILGTAAPTAVNTALLAHEFRADSGFAASAVFYSTLLSMITVTVTLVLVK